MLNLIFRVLLGFFFSVSIYAVSADQLLQSKLSGFQTIKADFSQVTLSNDGSVLQTSSGKMTIVRPGKFQWLVEKPLPQIIVTQKNQVLIYDPDLKQVIIRPLKNSAGATPALLLTQSNIDLTHEFKIKMINTDQFELIPIDEQEVFDHLIMDFKDGKLSQMTFANKLDQQTVIRFSHVVLNASIPDSIFNLAIPKDVDVVKL